MTKHTRLFILALILTGCGTNSNDSWTPEARSQFTQNCTTGAELSNPSVNAAAYCSCMLSIVSSRYSVDDYMARENSIVTSLRDDGTVSRCEK